VTVKAGAATITLKNGGLVEHDFTVDALSIQVHADPGKTTSETYQGLQPGTYEVYCSVPGHQQAGMVGQLIVE
jgi:plastocyanin